MRFERDLGEGFERAFPETFSFHAARHDPAELYLRLEDLWTNPARLVAGATRRDAEELVLRLLQALPAYLDATLERLAGGENPAPLVRASEDVAVFVQVVQRFVADKGLGEHPRLVVPSLHMRKLLWCALETLLRAHVLPEAVARYERGELVPPPSVDPHDVAFFYALAEGDAGRVEATLLAAAEQAYHEWLEDVCLDEANRAFDSEDSPFHEREAEVLAAVVREGRGPITRAGDLSPFLRRAGHRDCLRLLDRLEHWFLRQYDVTNAAAVLHHAESLKRGRATSDRVLTRMKTRTYLLALLGGALPFLLAIPFYDRWPLVFDVWVSAEVGLAVAAVFWFLAYRFMWKKDLSFFHASVPRIGAGIIVGYLPVFLIDEVWDLAEQSLFYIVVVVLLLGSTTLLYLYVEVQRRLGDPRVAFPRALSIFWLGIVEAAAFGLLVTSLLGPLMVVRNWGPPGLEGGLPALRESLPSFVGQLPPVVGLDWLPAFPTAVLLMTFLSFFIGTFLQLLWEDLPITEPL